MNSSSSSSPQDVVYPCAQCYVCYQDYRHLLEHLYWCHGTESIFCNKCNLKRWAFAEHICHVLPIYEDYIDNINKEQVDEVEGEVRESPYCYCGKNVDIPMIGCDGPRCVLQWYHFMCIGIEVPPPGEWFCPECCNSDKKQIKSYEETNNNGRSCSASSLMINSSVGALGADDGVTVLSALQCAATPQQRKKQKRRKIKP